MFAAGSLVFQKAGINAYSAQLRTAATDAWNWAVAHPGITFNNSGKLAAGEQEVDDYGLFNSRLCAAVYLYDITGDVAYKNWVENNYTQHHLLQWAWASMYEGTSMDALLHFTTLPDVSVSVVNAIRNTYSNSLSTADDHLGSFNSKADPYRAYLHSNNYVWGSNQIKSKESYSLMLNMLMYNLNVAQHPAFSQAAAGYLHYLHGTNPFGLCYLTNMKAYGAENSAREMYHTWFGDGTPWDNALTSPKGPAPGFLTGGANRYFSIDGCCPNNCGSTQNNALCATTTLQPPLNQPPDEKLQGLECQLATEFLADHRTRHLLPGSISEAAEQIYSECQCRSRRCIDKCPGFYPGAQPGGTSLPGATEPGFYGGN
jgi:endoglucanase